MRAVNITQACFIFFPGGRHVNGMPRGTISRLPAATPDYYRHGATGRVRLASDSEHTRTSSR